MNEICYSSWGMTDLEVTREFKAHLRINLEKVPAVPSKVMVIHYLPFHQSVDYKEMLELDYFSAFMGSKVFGTLIHKFNIP